MKRLINNSSRPARGFTLMELMVVLFILGLLMGLIVPAIGAVLRRAKSSATRASIKLISTACEEYKNDFGKLPPSTGGQAAAQLALLLTGYAPDENDDAIPTVTEGPIVDTFSLDDGAAGYGYRVISGGNVYGPYAGTENVDRIPNDAGYSVFADGFGMPIYYYRALDEPGEDPVYVAEDEESETSPLAMFDDYATDSAGRLYRKDYILISAGADTVFTPMRDDPSTDDITNFSNTD